MASLCVMQATALPVEKARKALKASSDENPASPNGKRRLVSWISYIVSHVMTHLFSHRFLFCAVFLPGQERKQV